jgi:hypothetical protein
MSGTDENKREADLNVWLTSSIGGTEPTTPETESSMLDDLQGAVADGKLGRRIDLVPVARYQRRLIIAIAVGVLVIVTGQIPGAEQIDLLVLLLILVFLGVIISTVVYSIQLASALDRAGASTNWLMAVFRGPQLISRATALLREYDLPVGLFGANPRIVDEAQKAGLHERMAEKQSRRTRSN